MKRLIQAEIDTNDLCSKFDLCRNEIIRIMNNFTKELNNFENQNNVIINNECIPTNGSYNPFNMNCNFGKNFSDFGSIATIFFNTYRDNVKQQMGEINAEQNAEQEI